MGAGWVGFPQPTGSGTGPLEGCDVGFTPPGGFWTLEKLEVEVLGRWEVEVDVLGRWELDLLGTGEVEVKALGGPRTSISPVPKRSSSQGPKT